LRNMNMDLGCSLPQSRILHGAVGTSYRQKYAGQVGFLDSRRGFGCGFLGKSVLRSRFSVENKVTCVSSCWNNSKVVSDGEFKVLNTKRSMSCKNEKLLMGSRVIWLKCQGNDSLAYVNGNGRNVDYVEGSGEEAEVVPISSVELDVPVEEEGGRAEKEIGAEEQSVDELKELLQKALKELEVAQINSTMFEEKVKKISETAIFLHDEAARSLNDVNSTLDTIQKVANEEHQAKEAVQNATMALSLAEARLQVAIESLEAAKEVHEGSNESDGDKDLTEKQSTLFVAQEDIKECQETLANCEVELRRLQNKKEELQNEANKLQEIAEKAQLDAVKAEEDVTNIMLLAEQAVAFELEATQRVNDAEIALQRANKSFTNLNAETAETIQVQDVVLVSEEENNVENFSDDVTVGRDKDLATIDDASLLAKLSSETESEKTIQISEDTAQSDYISDSENAVQTKKQETQKDLTKDSSPFAPKALSKKSSRFFSASFFSFTEEEAESTPASVFQGLILSAKKQLPKLVLGLLLMGAGSV
jgi:hypothetical protein